MKHFWRITLIAVVCYLLSILCFGPRFFLWISPSLYFPDTNRAICELVQLNNLAHNLPGQADTIRWRLLFPSLTRLFHLPWAFFFCLPFIFCFLLLLYVADLTYRRTGRYRWSFVAAALVATSSPIFISTGFLAYFDSALVLCLVACSFLRKSVSLGLVATMAVWIDERFILALPIVIWCQWLQTQKFSSAIPLLVGITPYLVIRLVAVAIHADPLTGHYIADLFRSPNDVSRMLVGLWDSLRWGWLPVVAVVVCAPQRQRRVGFVLLPLTLTLVAFSSGDYSRSFAIALPMLLLGLYELVKHIPEKPFLNKNSLPVFALAALNFITPAYHSFRAFRIPIKPLSAQIEFYQFFMKFRKTHKDATILPVGN